MRVGFDIGKIADLDGIGSYCRELLRVLPAELEEGEALWLYAPPGAVDETRLDELLGGQDVAAERVVRRLGADPADDDLDLYHATRWHCPPSLRDRGLFTCYDLTVLDHPNRHTVENRIHTLEGLFRALLDHWHFLSISHTTARALEHWLDITPERQTVVYPAAAPFFVPEEDSGERGGTEPQRAAAELERRFGIEGEPVLAVGTLEPRKNLPRLLTAYARLDRELRARHPLLLAGGMGWQDPAELESLLARPELSEARWLGAVSNEDLLWLYRGAAVFAYPSLAEGFGLPIVEAMACGAPVLTSAGGATEEVAGEAALCVPSTDVEAMASALAQLLADPAQRGMLRRRGFERAREFSWQKTAGAIAALYRRLSR